MRVGSISHTGTAWLVVLLAWGGVAAALISQHGFGFQPCPWCVIQRIAYLLVGAIALLSALSANRTIVRVLLGLAALAAIGGGVAGLYQHTVAAKTGSCAITAADRWIRLLQLDESLPQVFKATAACDEANLPMLGVPYSLWSVGLALLLLVLLARALGRTAAPSSQR